MQGFLRNKGKITVRSLWRYCNQAYSLRHLFRFFGEVHEWVKISISVFKACLYKEDRVYLIAIDETVIEKSGKKTHGKYKFYSSVFKQVIESVCFMGLSLIDVEDKSSYSIAQEQVIVTDADKQRIQVRKKKKKEQGKEKGKRGRPKGSRSGACPKTDTPAHRAFVRIVEKVFAVLNVYIPQIRVPYLVADSAYTAKPFVETLKKYRLHLISKLSADAVVYLPAQKDPNSPKKRGRPAKYGQKIKLSQISDEYLVASVQKDTYTDYLYQIKGYQKASLKDYLLNVVVVKRMFINGKSTLSVFFSTDLNLSPQDMIRYYALRFQIEFDFRNAKQHFGLNDFKNYKPVQLQNFVSMSFFMTLYSKILLNEKRTTLQNPNISIHDIKTLYHAHFHYYNLLKYISDSPEKQFLLQQLPSIIPPDTIHLT